MTEGCDGGRADPQEQGGAAALLRQRIASWPGVARLEGGERGLRFCSCGGEFLHFHGDRQVDLRLSIPDRDRAVAAGTALFHPRSHEGGWVMVPLAGCHPPAVLRLAAAAYRLSLQRAARAKLRSETAR